MGSGKANRIPFAAGPWLRTAAAEQNRGDGRPGYLAWWSLGVFADVCFKKWMIRMAAGRDAVFASKDGGQGNHRGDKRQQGKVRTSASQVCRCRVR